MFTLALLMGLGTTAVFADYTHSAEAATVSVAQATDNFTPVELKNLPQVVQDSLTKNFPDATLKAAAVSTNQETQTTVYKVTLEDAEGSEQIVLLSDKGDILK